MLRLLHCSYKSTTKQQRMMFGLIIALVVCVPLAEAQVESTTHVFPQVADGLIGDGTAFGSFMVVTNLNSSDASCSIAAPGLESRFLFLSFLLKAGSTQGNMTKVLAGPLTSGYAILTCTVPVYASLTYTFFAGTGHALGAATVFSAPASQYTRFLSIGVGRRAGVAIANPGLSPLTVSVSFTTADGTAIGKVVQIPAGSQYVRFVDEILGPIDYGVVEISSGNRFFLTALQFDGVVFTTLVPAWR